MDDKRLNEIIARKEEIRAKLESNDDVNIEELRAEIEKLNKEQTEIEERAKIAKEINENKIESKIVDNDGGKKNMNDFSTIEYRNAFMDYVKTIHDNGYDLDVSEWDPEWTAAVEDGSVFCFVLPTWGYSFVIKQNAQSSSGKWGLCEGPNPYVNGGTWLGIYKDSPNKEAAWDFLSYMTLNKDVLKDYSVTYGEYVDLKSADEELARVDGEDTLNGQNIYQVYNKVMAENPHVTITQYDEQINAAYKSAVRSYAEGKLTKEKAIEQFKADVSNAYPDLKVQ